METQGSEKYSNLTPVPEYDMRAFEAVDNRIKKAKIDRRAAQEIIVQNSEHDRREFLKKIAIGGAVLAGTSTAVYKIVEGLANKAEEQEKKGRSLQEKIDSRQKMEQELENADKSDENSKSIDPGEVYPEDVNPGGDEILPGEEVYPEQGLPSNSPHAPRSIRDNTESQNGGA